MRVGVWRCGAAVALLAVVAASALRPSQVEGSRRIGRRTSTVSIDESSDVTRPSQYGDIEYTSSRPRGSRRREETQELRKKTRSRPERIESSTQDNAERTERTRNIYSRTRNRTKDETEKSTAAPVSRSNRQRQSLRRPTTREPELSSPTIDVTKIEVINTDLEEMAKLSFDDDQPSSQFRRRSSGRTSPFIQSTERATPRKRVRAKTRISTSNVENDLTGSGTTNSITMTDKGPSTARSYDERTVRKLRYKTRLSETETNLTGKGLKPPAVTKSSQNNDITPSQPELQTSTPIIVVAEPAQSTESTKPSTTVRITKVVRRPTTSRKSTDFRPSVSLPSMKITDEISEDDNYPESFKALLQAKNASTQANSPSRESLSVIASQKVYNTYTTTLQSTTTGSEKLLNSTRFRVPVQLSYEDKDNVTKVTTEVTKEEEKATEVKEAISTEATVVDSNIKSTRRPDSRSRVIYSRNRKTSTPTAYSSSTTEKPGTVSNKPVYKFNRKIKITTTPQPKTEDIKTKQLNTNNLLKKTLPRSSYYSRFKSSTRSDVSAEAGTTANDNKVTSEKPNTKSARPSYKPRYKSSKNNTTHKERSRKINEVKETNKKVELIEKPVTYKTVTMITSNDNMAEIKPEKLDEPELFVISVNTKAPESMSQETITEAKKDSHNYETMQFVLTTPVYHSRYKDLTKADSEDSTEEIKVYSTPTIRNLQTRKFERRKKEREDTESSTSKPAHGNWNKFTESHKSGTVSSNGITPEYEKPKTRFSSKYRASYLDNPVYKPTVPTVTPTTAWLKFFVTDRELLRAQEPYWFEGELLNNVSTEPMDVSLFTASPPVAYDPTIQLVEGEENQLGPDLNSISFTQTRSTLSSADLRLSESAKSSLVMNVEATNHSPSVTVSIFDALAEILTSTPRPLRLSSTTEFQKNIITDAKQTPKGVSNQIINVNKDLSTVDMFMSTSADITASTQTARVTDQNSPNVINLATGMEKVTPSLINFISTQAIPTPIPTPVSARKPFAVKILYSNTELPTDKVTTAPEPTSQPSTDQTTMVYNTVSDLILYNNNLVSSELTSMLSNNIKNILSSMNKNTKSKFSVDNMTKLLKKLIPRALGGKSLNSDDVDIEPMTTPYSLEEIRDTEVNIDFRNKSFISNISDSSYLLENVTSSSVNTEETTTSDILPTVNNPNIMSDYTSTTASETKRSTTIENSILSTTPMNLIITSTSTTTTNSAVSKETELPNLLVEDAVTENLGNTPSVILNDGITNNEPPVPFLTNFMKDDFVSINQDKDENLALTKTVPLSIIPENPASSSPTLEQDITTVPKPSSNVSPVQLWILSKKARVLKMIEELIKQHNNELVTYPPLLEAGSGTNPLPLSQRLTEILNNINPTTSDGDDLTRKLPTTTANPDPNPSTPQIVSPVVSEDITTTTASSKTEDVGLSTTTQTLIDTTTESGGSILNAISANFTTEENKTLDTTTSTTVSTFETQDVDTTTVSELETTTKDEVVATTNLPEETTTQMMDKNTTSVDSTTIISIIPPNPPKKDYVIFGILPNNTVVRKNPNEDILETLTESIPYIVYGVLPNNTVIRKFPNGTRVPRVLQKIDVLPISPWSLRNPYSPIHNNPAIVRPQSNPIRVSTNVVTSTDISNNGKESRLTSDTVNNQQLMIPSSALNVTESSTFGVLTTTNRPSAGKSTASHVLSLRTSTMLPSVEEILLNSLSSAAKQEMIISSMTSSTHEPRILTLDIDPETKEIRTEKPSDGNGSAVFKFIPIDEVNVVTQNSNVQKLATKPSITTMVSDTTPTFTEANTQTPQIVNYFGETNEKTTLSSSTELAEEFTSPPIQTTTADMTTTNLPTTTTTEPTTTTTEPTTTTTKPTTTTTKPTTTTIATTTSTEQITTTIPTTTTTEPTTTTSEPATTTTETTTRADTTTTLTSTTFQPVATNIDDDEKQFQQDAELLKALLQATGRDPKSLSIFSDKIKVPKNEVNTLSATKSTDSQPNIKDVALLQTLINAGTNSPSISFSNIGGNIDNTATTTQSPSTTNSIEDDIKQFEEDSKLLQVLLQATGQNNINIPTLNNIDTSTFTATTTKQKTTTQQTTTVNSRVKAQQDAQFLQALLQAQDSKNSLPPIITGKTSNVRLTSTMTTTQYPTFTLTTTHKPILSTTDFKTESPVTTTFQPMTEGVRISTTNDPRRPTSAINTDSSTIRTNERGTFPTARRVPSSRFTTEMPSTSTFSVEEDIQFLQNLKSVLNTETNADPETVLANRVIALAVEKSLNEIQTKQSTEPSRDVPVTASVRTQKTTTTTTTTQMPSTTIPPSIEADIKQFQEDSKLLQALLKATGQDPSKLNLPSITNGHSNVRDNPKNLSPAVNNDLNLLSNLLASPSPLNEPFDALNKKPSPIISTRQKVESIPRTTTPSSRPYGAKITVNGLTNDQDEAFIKSLIKLQGPETSTQRNKVTISAQNPDVALRLLSKTKATGMVSEATQTPMSLSTEYGKSNDALLAALLKEQGFGPTTASSLDEQIRLAALLNNQVVVTPKARTTTLPPPPPAPRRPILDGLAWLWQQWRETSPGAGQPRPNRRPAPAPQPGMSSSASTSNRINWFGSGPMNGNSEQRPTSTSNRIPLDPPRATESANRGQLVSAAINVTRAFSQFLGAAIQGAAQTVQNVIRAGQRATADVYTNGSG